MKVVIIEDEPPAREKLAKFIGRYDRKIEITAQIESVRDTIDFLDKSPLPDLIFADIELLDGNVFRVFEDCKITCPIIFTTAYDQFLLQAFEQNGIAYLLKPFDFQKFTVAMQKFETLRNNFAPANNDFWHEIQTNFYQPKYKERFVIKTPKGIQLLETKQIAFIQMQNEIPFAFDATGNKFPLNDSLTMLEKLLDSKQFFRLNRSEIVNLNFIENLKPDFQDRLVVSLRNLKVKLVSSINRTPELRKWLENQ
ncbi:MAG: LytTR family DNA-binding domain-containing protein [Pyrinomonadaceae bacterium]|nr:LytTR family DNA-binding domain-containing protein [Pyrinomonadaceae bacterium]